MDKIMRPGMVTKMNKKISMIIVLALILMLAAPTFAIAAPGDEANITIEYRYAEGTPVEIPDRITQLGREYVLILQGDPVLESTLPQTRTRSYKVGGGLSPADLDLVKDLANTTIKPVNVSLEREVDKTVNLTLPNNDIDDIPLERDFDVSSSSGGTQKATLQRAGVEFDIKKDSTGFPTNYIATVVYRGVETYMGIGYYLVETTYNSEEDAGSINQYVIIAEYEPVIPEDIPAATPINAPEDNTPPPAQPQQPTTTGLSAEDQVRMDNQTGNILTDIGNGNVPLGSGAVKAAWSVFSLLLSIAAVVFSIVLIISSLTKRKKTVEKYDDGEYDPSGNTIGKFLKIIAILIGFCVALMFYVFEDFSLPMVWINSYTVVIGTMFLIQIVVFGIYSVVNNRKGNDREPTTMEA